MKNKVSQLLLWLLLCCAFSGASAQDYYVSALTGSDTNDGLTPQTPLATIQKGADIVGPGGKVFIMTGTYTRITRGAVLEFTRAGTPDAYITFTPYPGHNPILTSTGDSWDTAVIDGSYVILDGLEFAGNNANLTLAGAQESYLQSRATPAVFNARFNTNAMAVAKNAPAHHVIIRNCKVHDFPGGGIGVGGADYVTIENNTVYNNSWYTMYATSGISILGPKPIDTFTGYKMFVRGNTVYNNFTQVRWRRTSLAADVISDGNGIILDVNNGNQGTPVYTGRTLVENNVSYNNGGGGIHAFQVARVDIINNTAYNNGRVVGYPEIDGQSSTDVKIYNNIMYARTGGNCNGNDGAGVVYDFNVYYNGPFLRQGANDVVADPNFVKLAPDASADFRLRAPSPALNTGSAAPGLFSAQDITGLARPQGSRPERGAYEFQSGNQAQTITFAVLPALQVGAADYDPQATASSGLPVTYRSSDNSVATIIDGKIQLVSGGTATITAQQGGDATYAAAPEVSQTLTVDATGYGPLSLNSTFETGTEGWRVFVLSSPAAISIAAVPRTGYTGNALEATVTPLATGAGTFDVQLIHAMPVEAGKTYTIRFRASTVTPPPSPAGALDLIVQSDKVPFTTYRSFFATRFTATATNYTFSFTPAVTDETTQLKFMLGRFNTPVYIDDVTITSTPTPVMVIKQGATVIADNTPTGTTSNFNFGTVAFGSPKKVTFTIENTGTRTLNLLYAQKISITGPGFSLATNAPAPTIAAGGKVTFEVEFAAPGSGTFQGNLVIANSDPAVNKNPYNFLLSATGVQADQTIDFADSPDITYGDAPRSLAATASSGLPVSYTLISGPGSITQGNVLSYTGVGELVVEATQTGSTGYNAAAPVRRTFTVGTKELLVTAENKTVTYGDAIPVYTYTITGFVLNETEAQISGRPELSSPYKPTTPATETPVISVAAGTLSAANYRFTLVNGQVTIKHTFPQLLEAEMATIVGGRVVTQFAGYTGAGYVTKINKGDNTVEWTANVSGAGVSTLTFRFASDNPAQTLVLTVNGQLIPGGVRFANTGGWRNWTTVSVPATLKAGINTIRLSGSGSAGPNLDNLVITNDTYGAPALARTSGISQSARAASADKPATLIVQVYPVPASTSLRVAVPAQGQGEIVVQIIDKYGRVVSSQRASAMLGLNDFDFDVRAVPAGTYIVRTTTAELSMTKFIQIEH
ncbi:choice-of-anchor D domain-containing protein [Hymenobacter arizonensis]|uniref:Por secretion system C-terminal sorting domain-containing protein n=1 Tax=Hymenobacter arizonensis TaxID=1227077 RepID=A0A1I6BJ53_HYMAR|nr:choice-of-anchor D domain-containing protein [Hymenobacter arizonensis]SFQ80959.1 Por secretion system C-terminal sorting domain-containing protein [Hymenobacter arizonensis]